MCFYIAGLILLTSHTHHSVHMGRSHSTTMLWSRNTALQCSTLELLQQGNRFPSWSLCNNWNL